MLGVGRLGRDLVGQAPEAVDVALAAALRHEPAAGSQRGMEPGEQGGWSVIQWKTALENDRVHRLGQLELHQVHRVEHLHRSFPAKRRAGLVDHRRGGVGGHHPALREQVEQHGGDAAGAAAGVEHGLVARAARAARARSRAISTCGSETRS